jgi:hypothetical protein
MRITFKTEDSYLEFHAMAEGMWQNASDDNVSPNGAAGERAVALEMAISATYTDDSLIVYPVSYDIPAGLAAAVSDIVENMQYSTDESEAALAHIEVQS